MAKKVIKDLLKKAMANGDQSSAANAYKSMAAKKDTVSIPFIQAKYFRAEQSRLIKRVKVDFKYQLLQHFSVTLIVLLNRLLRVRM